MKRYAKINDNGQLIASSGNVKVLRYGKKVVINPRASDFVKAGYLPIVNDDEVAEEREGYVVSGVRYDYNGTLDGIVKSFLYVEAPAIEEEPVGVEEPANGEEE